MRNADLFSSNAPNLLKQATRHALTPSSIYFSAKQGNCNKKQPLVILMQVQIPIGDLLIKKLGTVLKILTNENMNSGQFVHQNCQRLCPVGKM